MKRIHKFIPVLVIAASLAGGIVSVFGAETSNQPIRGKSREGDFIRGATVWADNCVRCHNLRAPEEFNDLQWKLIVTHMRVRAGLTGQETRDVIAFLQQSN